MPIIFSIVRRLVFVAGLVWLALAGGRAAGADAFAMTNAASLEVQEATGHLGQWIWDTNTFDKQTVRFWRAFEIPAGATVSQAVLWVAVDNGFSLFLDGREIGRGSDWKTLNQYDLQQVLPPGRHVLAVEGFNDRLKAGMIMGLHVQLSGEQTLELRSDNSWYVAGEGDAGWAGMLFDQPGWHRAVVVGKLGTEPWIDWPYAVLSVPATVPVLVRFWQTGWFELSLAGVCGLAVLFSVWLIAQLAAQRKTESFLHRERARIARDIHDELGGQLTQIVLLGEVAQREHPEHSPAREQFRNICGQARELSRAMDEVVWAVNSRRDTLGDFVTYVCKYAQFFLGTTAIRCRLDVELDLPDLPFDLPVRRNLFLAVKEALNNVAKHSQAGELFVRIFQRDQSLVVVLEDNGRGFDPAQTDGQRNGLTNMAERMAEIRGTFKLFSRPGGGCEVTLAVPLPKPGRGRWFGRRREKIGAANPAA